MKMEQLNDQTNSKTPLTDAAEAAVTAKGFSATYAEEAAWEHARKMERLYNKERKKSKRVARSLRIAYGEE